MFADGDFILFQSNAILRYLGRKHGKRVWGDLGEGAESLVKSYI